MTKAEVVSGVAENAGISQRQAKKALDAVLKTITDALASGETVHLVDFGVFEAQRRAAKIGRNPETGESIVIPPARVPKFRAGKALKEQVAGRRD